METTENVSEFITIVIPVLNREATIERTLASVYAQSLRPAEVIIVDNGSTDSTYSIVDKWVASRPYASILKEPKPGACAARNRGLELVKTPYVMFFDSDDEMLPHHVRDFEEAASRTRADIIGRTILTEFSNGTRRHLWFSARTPMFRHLFNSTLSTQRIIVKTELVRRVGGWNETLPGWNDFELGVRLLQTSPKMYHLFGKPSVITYQTPGSITGTSFSEHPERWEKSLAVIREEIAPRLRPLVDARTMVLAARYAAEGATEHARRLYDEVMSRTPHKRRMAFVYRHNLIFGHGTWVLVRLLFPIICSYK